MNINMQEKFVDHFCLTGNATQAAIEAGYSQKTAKQQGHRLKNQLGQAIEEKIKKLLLAKIPLGINWLLELAESSQSDSVRLGAVKDLLDRAGLKPIERIEQTNVENKSRDEILKELDALRSRRH
jgi:phage terminase small subunit|tara:strand:+ start:802 stop:1176 length:375 start_codon:yes stop_codon:yes gene_type:complete